MSTSPTPKPVDPAFLQEMGQVVADQFAGFQVNDDGSVGNDYGTYTPRTPEQAEPLDSLFAAMKMVGLDPTQYKFQEYDVIAPDVNNAGKLGVTFPTQLAIKSNDGKFEGLKQLDLVLRTPIGAATEIQEGM